MKKISGIIITIGVIILFGTVGACDMGRITFMQTLERVMISLAIIGGGMYLRMLPKIIRAICIGEKKAKRGIAILICAYISEKALIRTARTR